MMALTATATAKVRDEIAEQLMIPRGAAVRRQLQP